MKKMKLSLASIILKAKYYEKKCENVTEILNGKNFENNNYVNLNRGKLFGHESGKSQK